MTPSPDSSNRSGDSVFFSPSLPSLLLLVVGGFISVFGAGSTQFQLGLAGYASSSSSPVQTAFSRHFQSWPPGPHSSRANAAPGSQILEGKSPGPRARPSWCAAPLRHSILAASRVPHLPDAPRGVTRTRSCCPVACELCWGVKRWSPLHVDCGMPLMAAMVGVFAAGKRLKGLLGTPTRQPSLSRGPPFARAKPVQVTHV